MATLSIHEYINHLLTGVKDGSGDVEVKQDNMLIANVLQLKPEEQMIYSRKIVGSKSLNVFLEFSKDMVGSTGAPFLYFLNFSDRDDHNCLESFCSFYILYYCIVKLGCKTF